MAPRKWVLQDFEVEDLTADYAQRLEKLHFWLTKLYNATLRNDVIDAEMARCGAIVAARTLPSMADWPESEEELQQRLLSKFRESVPAVTQSDEESLELEHLLRETRVS